MGGTGISKSEVSRICAQLDAEVATWRTRPLDDQPFPYVFLDATYCKARINGRQEQEPRLRDALACAVRLLLTA